MRIYLALEFVVSIEAQLGLPIDDRQSKPPSTAELSAEAVRCVGPHPAEHDNDHVLRVQTSRQT